MVGSATPPAEGLTATSSCPGWAILSSPNHGSDPSLLNAVSVYSPQTAWAVGNWYDAGADVVHTLVEQWSGTAWFVYPSADPGDSRNTLQGVSFGPDGSAWAVGFSQSGGSGFRTLIERPYANAWTAVPSPSPGDEESVLWGVSNLSHERAWAVGYQQDAGGPRRTLIERWNGSSWKAMTSPNVGDDDNLLYGVVALAPDDVWAVGVYSVPWFQTLTLHWNGRRWKVVPSPNVGDGNNFLYSVAALGDGTLMVVGSSLTDTGTATLALRLEGDSWAVLPTPNTDAGFDELLGVAAYDPTAVWAVGHRQGAFRPFRTLAERWDGVAWTAVKPPNRGSSSNDLYGVSSVPGTGGFFAVGRSTSKAGLDRTLVERICPP